MYKLIYCSKASPDLKVDDISAILKTARDFNFENNITGCLLFHNREFIQILEGEKEIVEDLYSNIVHDKRHFDVTLLAKGDKEARAFNSWSMAFHELTKDDESKIGKELFVSNFIAFSEIAKRPTFAMVLFWNKAKKLLERNN